MITRYAIAILTMLAMSAFGQQRINPDALITAEFQKKVEDYVKLRKSIASKLTPLKPGIPPQEMDSHERDLAARIRHARRHAKQGDIFTPRIEAEFRRLVGLAANGADARRIAKSLKHAEPVQLGIRVNETYPDNVPLQSMPPTLLANFPELPPEVEYRVVGQQLVLVDIKTNLILDFSKTAFLPKPQ